LLRDYGIADPKDIDLPAIAHCVGVEIQYRPLVSCEAQIIGYRDRAVVYVNPDPRPQRRKFSTGHELGHWHHHRGKSFACRSTDIGRPVDPTSKDAERLADAYSSDLILPPFMVTPRLDGIGDVTLAGIIEMANLFSASVTATAIRVMRMTKQPLMLVAHNLYGRMWQWASITAKGLRVRDDIDTRSSSMVALMSGAKGSPPRKEAAHYWFDRRHIEQFDVKVEFHRTIEGEGVTLLRILSPEMISIYGG